MDNARTAVTQQEADRMRELAKEGVSIAQIARDTGRCVSTVRKYISSDGPVPERRKGQSECPPSMEPYRGLLEQWVNEDEGKRRKHRKTCAQMIRMLREEHGYTGCDTCVQNYVGKLKRKLFFKEMCKPDSPPGRKKPRKT